MSSVTDRLWDNGTVVPPEPADSVAGRALAPAGTRNGVANQNWQRQYGGRWCWAACCVMIGRAIGLSRINEHLPLTQCGFYKLVSGKEATEICDLDFPDKLTGLCSGRTCAASFAKNHPDVVSTTLLKLNLQAPYPGVQSIDGRDNITDKQIREMIDNGWPVAVMIKPVGSTSDINHYVLITGYDIANEKYEIWDPDPSQNGWRTASFRRWTEIGEWIGAVALWKRPA